MKTVLKVVLGVVGGIVAVFVVAVAVGVIGNIQQSREAIEEVTGATSQVVIEAPADVQWTGTVGGVAQAGQGPATLDVPNTGSDKAKEFKAFVQKTTPGDDLITVILHVDGEEGVRESTREVGTEVQVSVRVSLRKENSK